MVPADPTLPAPSPVPAAPAADAVAVNARALIGDQLAMLSRLAQIGMEIAEDCGRQAKAAAADPGADAALPSEHRRDPGLAFARVARAVRMTIALQSRLLKDLAELDRAGRLAEQARTDRRRTHLSRLVERAVEAEVTARHAPSGPADAWSRSVRDQDAIEDEIERLSSEAYERLTDAEDGDFEGRSFEEAVAAICADLGLSPEWTARIAAAVEPTVEVRRGAAPAAGWERGAVYPQGPWPPPDLTWSPPALGP